MLAWKMLTWHCPLVNQLLCEMLIKANRLCTLQVQLLRVQAKLHVANNTQSRARKMKKTTFVLAHDWMMEDSRASAHLLSWGAIALAEYNCTW